MSRLTEKNEKLGYIWTKEENFSMCHTNSMNKLGQLEDIEEELGIDLITLFKALSQGVFLKNGNRVEHHFVFLCKYQGKWALGYEYSMRYGLQGWCLETKKYKQHWAVSKEELQ